jgi:GDP-4-dehydro-6-deoxy-D-mannose reductase
LTVLVTGGSDALSLQVMKLLPKGQGPLVAAGRRGEVSGRVRSGAAYVKADLRDPRLVENLLSVWKPERIYHLAGMHAVGEGETDPLATLDANLEITHNLLASARRHCPTSRIVVLSSGEVYGRGPSRARTEEELPAPMSVLGVSKVAVEALCGQAARAFGQHVVVARLFNHVGAWESRRYLFPQLAAQLARIKILRGEPVIYSGDLELLRDILDVRDAARGLQTLMENAEAGALVNVCSGQSLPLRQLAEDLVTLTGLSVQIRLDPRRERSNEIPFLCGSNAKLRALGWKVENKLRDSLRDLWSEMLDRVSAELKGNG